MKKQQPWHEFILKAAGMPSEAVEQSVLSLGDQQTVYGTAYGFYEGGNYEQAASLFTHLVLSSPFEVKFWKGLASSRQMEEKYEEALHAWSLTALLREEDPLPHFHAAECLLTRGETDEALKALNMAAARLTEQDSELRSKITLLQATYGTHP